MKKILFRIFLGLLLVGVLLAGWIAFDIYTPHKVDIREFDADEIARLDTAMWRSYYSRERLQMYSELTELLQKQYKLRFWRKTTCGLLCGTSGFCVQRRDAPIMKRLCPIWKNFTRKSAMSARLILT